MILNNSTVIHGIDWCLDENYITKFSEAKSLRDLIKLTDKLPLSKGTVKFSDDLWDFSGLTTLNVPHSKLKFNFKNVSTDYKEILKLFVLIRLLEDTIKVQSIHRKFVCLRLFFKYLYTNNIYSLDVVTPEDIGKYIVERRKTISIITLELDKSSISDIFLFYSANYKDIYTPELAKALKREDYELLQSCIEQNKYPAIPLNYLQKLLNLFIQTMNDENAPLEDRAFACLMLIESQTGLRASDLTALEIDNIYINKFSDKEIYYLNYCTIKREKGNNISSTVFTFINELSHKAYKKLTELHDKNRKKRNSKLLYVPPNGKKIPVDSEDVIERMIKFSIKNNDKLNCVNNNKLNDLSGKKPFKTIFRDVSGLSNYFKNFKETDILYYPNTHQFRVNVCTELYHKGVPLEYIQEYMAHLSSDIQDYYVRPKKNYQENIVYSKEILKEIVTGEAKLLGKNVDALNQKIKDFIEQGKFNVSKDIGQIIDELIKKIPIRAKLGGICIKSSMLRDCSTDAKTDEFYCAYGVCPNHFHLFYMADITYDRYLTLKKTYTYNKENGFLRQSEKEKFKLINVIKDMLLPELNEVKSEIDKSDASLLKEKHPQLTHIIDNYDSIYKEVTSWIK